MKRTQIQLREEQIKWLKRHAAENSVSMAQLIRESIDYYRMNAVRSRQLQQQKKNALTVVGSFSSIDN